MQYRVKLGSGRCKLYSNIGVEDEPTTSDGIWTRKVFRYNFVTGSATFSTVGEDDLFNVVGDTEAECLSRCSSNAACEGFQFQESTGGCIGVSSLGFFAPT